MANYLKGLRSCFLLFFLNIYPSYAEIRIGTEFFNPPYIISEVEGFDVTLMNTICQGLKENCVFVPMNFDALFPALEGGKVDLIISGLSITKKEKANIFLVCLICSVKRNF